MWNGHFDHGGHVLDGPISGQIAGDSFSKMEDAFVHWEYNLTNDWENNTPPPDRLSRVDDSARAPAEPNFYLERILNEADESHRFHITANGSAGFSLDLLQSLKINGF